MPIPADLIERAQASSRRSGQPFPAVLEDLLGLPANDFAAALGAHYAYPVVGMDEINRMPPAFDVLPLREAIKRGCLAFRSDDGRIRGVIGDPTATAVQAWAEAMVGAPVAWHVTHYANIPAYFNRHEEELRALDTLVTEVGTAGTSRREVEEISLQSISEVSSSVIRLVQSTLYDALKAQASDIHMEATAQGLIIKYRIDGVLTQVGEIAETGYAEQVISRIKVVSELDIAERRIPQDGRFKVSVRGREIDFRVSIMPSIFGEDAVIRILDKEALSGQLSGLRLDNLGFDPQALRLLRRMAREPYGMMLVTGPTGSGKTTTLYAAISEINHGEDKIITIEDPVEYQLPGVLQIPVNEKKGLTFARGLRSILRHDPDKIMVGEIRDPETAQIAVQSALTGHLVFTTVHANNVFDVIGRFIHMGVDPYSFVSALNSIMAQRLIRLVCPHCAADETPDAELLAASGLSAAKAADFRFRVGRGCGHCRGSGYRGRKAIAEFLVLNDELREVILQRESIRSLKAAAAKNGTLLLRDAALESVRRGETTLQEINRVTFVSEGG